MHHITIGAYGKAVFLGVMHIKNDFLRFYMLIF